MYNVLNWYQNTSKNPDLKKDIHYIAYSLIMNDSNHLNNYFNFDRIIH